MHNRNISTSGVGEMIAAMVLSGTLGLFVFESGQSAVNVVFFRTLFGALSLGIYCGWRGLLTRHAFTRTTLLLTLAGGAALVANWVLLFSAYNLASISIATAVYHTQPFFLVIFGALVLGEAMNAHKIGWLLMAFTGLLLVIEVDATATRRAPGELGGLGLALGAAVLYAIATLITKRLAGIRPHLIALVQVSLGAVLLFPWVDFAAVPPVGPHWLYLITLGVVHTCIMYILMYSAFQKLPTPTIAVLSFIYPAVAIVVDYLFYAQDLSARQFIGIALILTGSAAVNLGWRLLPAIRRARP